MRNAMFLASAVALAVSGSAMLTGAAQAADNEKCFGVAAAGQGDAWIYVPAGTCAKINGGSLEPKQS